MDKAVRRLSPPALETLGRLFDEASARRLLACMTPELLRAPFAALALIAPNAAIDDIIEVYFTNKAARHFSPNLLFDEAWYRASNPDIAKAIQADLLVSGFVHFVCFGARESRWPNPTMQAAGAAQPQAFPALAQLSAETYLEKNPMAAMFLRGFPIFTPLEHYNFFGRKLGLLARGERRSRKPVYGVKYHNILASEFDGDFYTRTYLTAAPDRAQQFSDKPFQHYLMYGLGAGHAPNAWFDEAWYRAFYTDIGMAIARGEIPCGFFHFLTAGREEGRLPTYNRKAALEARMPGVTKPVLLERIADLATRQKPIAAKLDDSLGPRIWFLLPTINPDITFGGYRGAFELLRALRDNQYDVGIICTEDASADKNYFLWREESETLRALVRQIPVLNRAHIETLAMSPHDSFVAYSIWDLSIADQLARDTAQRRVFLFAQEYEPIFYDNGGMRAIAEAAYDIAHYPIINSEFLRKFLAARKIGVFGKPGQAELFRDYAVFEHRVNKLATQTEFSIKKRKTRILAAYARPEGHAARNLFEIVVLALRLLCQEGRFGPEWRFVGLGALTDLPPVSLSGGHELRMVPKMSEAEYRDCLGALDIGLSLMFAPHPSVVPFEFATTGALVITNTYENRSADELRAICGNIIPCAPSVAGVAAALRAALTRVDDAADRAANAYQPATGTWEEIFTPPWLEQIFMKPGAGDLSIVAPIIMPAAKRRDIKPDYIKPASRPAARVAS